MAVVTGLEPVIFAVTGRCPRPTERNDQIAKNENTILIKEVVSLYRCHIYREYPSIQQLTFIKIDFTDTTTKKMALTEGLEPTTYRLTADCSTIELHQNKNGADHRIRTCNGIAPTDYKSVPFNQFWQVGIGGGNYICVIYKLFNRIFCIIELIRTFTYLGSANLYSNYSILNRTSINLAGVAISVSLQPV